MEQNTRPCNRCFDWGEGEAVKIVAIMPVRNEDWILGMTARALLKWVDELVILDHCSTDASRDIEGQLKFEDPFRVCLMRDDNPVWDEMRLLERARICDATHIVTVDADEILTSNLLPEIRARVAQIERPMSVLQLPGYNLRGSIDRYHKTGIWGNRWFTVAFKDQPGAGWSGDRLHHREPFQSFHTFQPIPQGAGGMLHLWGASERRLAAKQALYKITERIRWPGKATREIDAYYNLAMHPEASRGTGFTSQWEYATVPNGDTMSLDLVPISGGWWAGYEDLLRYLHVEAEPWQEAECKKLVREYGISKFKGLDLFGVVE